MADERPNQQPAPVAVWASGAAYEAYVGRWSRLVAREFVAWLGVAPESHWLDVGCGTGALMQAILQLAQPRAVLGVDASEAFLALGRQQVQDERARFEAGDAQALAVDDGSYDAAVAGLVINHVPLPGRAIAEMARAVRPGGVVAAYVWDYSGKMQPIRHFWNAAAALDPGAADLDQGRRYPLCRPEPLAALWQAANLRLVETTAIDVNTDFASFDDYWVPFTAGQGPAPSYAVSLSDERRAALRERLRAALPTALDGSVPLVARAWAVRGVKIESSS
jgi:SAM-dependent methyltransferase